MNIDGTNLRLGRVATVVAKAAILGETVNIVNVDKIIVTGDKKTVFAKYRKDDARGTPSTGPFIPKTPIKMVKRSIRGMIGYKQPKGRAALERIKCYTKIPAELKDVEFISIKEAHIDESLASKYTTIGAICKNLGGKDE